MWRQRLDEAGSYENFLKIPILEKSVESADTINSAKVSGKPSSPSTRYLPKVRSFGRFSDADMGNDKNMNDNSRGSPTTGSRFLRTRSFSGTSTSNSTAAEGRGSSPSSPCSLSLAHTLDPVVVEELGERTADLLLTTTARLKEARLAAQESQRNKQEEEGKQEQVSTGRGEIGDGSKRRTKKSDTSHKTEEAANALKYLLVGVVKRNHLALDDILVENARSIAESGRHGLSLASRKLIRCYYEEVERGLDWIAESPPVAHSLTNSNNAATAPTSINNEGEAEKNAHHENELWDRITLVRRMKQNMGRTALMLSGGGAIAMYHLGVIRALIESGLYDDIKVISGTSGGSISAAMNAIRTGDELYREVCVPNVSTDFLGTGEQKKMNIRWFPPIMDMAAYWLKNRLLVDSALFRKTCEFYYGDLTFEEAFEKTGKHVCITVSASRASEGGTAQRLLLNHISTPQVTLASAVAASCALPGVMAPAKLLAKNSAGTLEPFEVDGVDWIDGSVQADLPFKRISTLFAVSSFIVSQVNFHVIPFLNKAHHPNQKSLYWNLFQLMEWDIRNRALKLSRLGLFPKMFGQDISKVFKQRYHGNLTIVPRFTTMQSFGLKALSNPSVQDMEGYLKYGQIATWPYLNAIRDMIRLEKALDDCLHRLEDRVRSIAPDFDWSTQDDVESIASSTAHASSAGRQVKIVGKPPLGVSVRDRDAERMKKKMIALEQENQKLRHQLAEMISRLEKANGDSNEIHDGKNESIGRSAPTASVSDGSEGAVFNLVRRKGNGWTT